MITVMVSGVSFDQSVMQKSLICTADVEGNEVTSESEDVLPILNSYTRCGTGATLEERLINTLPCWNAYVLLELAEDDPDISPG